MLVPRGGKREEKRRKECGEKARGSCGLGTTRVSKLPEWMPNPHAHVSRWPSQQLLPSKTRVQMFPASQPLHALGRAVTAPQEIAPFLFLSGLSPWDANFYTNKPRSTARFTNDGISPSLPNSGEKRPCISQRTKRSVSVDITLY